MSDHLRSIELIEALAPGCSELKSTTIDGSPVSKARARFTKRGGVYHPSENRDAEQRTAWHLKRLCPQPMTGNVALSCMFFRPNRQRVDADNLLKHVCDAANGVLWLDDSQVTAIAAVVELDAQRPRSVITFARAESTLKRDRGVVLACEHCGAPFTKKSKPQKMCSQACQIAAQRIRVRAASTNPRTPCETCGGPTSKGGVKRCRSCWKTRSTPNTDRDALDSPGVVIRIYTEEPTA
jgi:Holliday junction resolvase RusA-like endonuclease